MKFREFIGIDKMSHDLCDEIIEVFHQNKDFHFNGQIGNFDKDSSDEGTKEDDSIKKSTDYRLQDAPITCGKFINSLHKSLDKYVEKFAHCCSYPMSVLEGVNVQYYKKSEGFKEWHSEKTGLIIPIFARQLVFMTYLNDVPDAGTEFLYQKIRFQAKKGTTLIWPADWQHTHRGQVSHKNEKYIVTGWISLIAEHHQKNKVTDALIEHFNNYN
jgi:hypothetical protein